MTLALPTRFWSKVDVRGSDECWLWQGERDNKGYGRFMLDGRNQHAHRVALALDGRPLAPRKDYACHHCDVKPCVNPRHLYVGTATTNRRDAIERGLARYNPLRGEASPRSKLDTAAVLVIRDRARSGIPQRLIAREFGLAQGHVSRIVTGRNWSHVA